MTLLEIDTRLVEPTSVRRSYKAISVTTQQPAYVTEFNLFSPKDKQTLNALKYIWKDDELALMSDIFEYESASTNDVKSRYFVLTKQSDEFEKIKPSAVLGVVKTTSTNKGLVEFDNIIINPFYVYNNPYSDLSNVGRTFMNALHDKFVGNKLRACVPKNEIPFFKKIGWKIVSVAANKQDYIMEFKKALKTGIKK